MINFGIPKTYNLTVLNLSIKTYLSFGTESTPFTSTHSVPIKSNNFIVKFFPEMTKNEIVSGLTNKVYFQVESDPNEGSIENIEF